MATLAGQVGFVMAVRFSAAEGLPPVEVTAIAADGAGRLWVGTGGGLRLLAGGRFVVEASMTATGIASPVHREAIRDIAVSPAGEVWVATAGTLHRRTVEGRWAEGAGSDAGLDGGVATVLATPDGDIWAGGENAGLARRDGSAWSLFDRGFRVTELAIDGNGALWAAGSRDGEILVRNPGTPGEAVMPFGTAGLPGGSPQALEGDADGAWIGTSRGLAFVPTEGTVTAAWDGESGLPSPSILAIAPAGGGAAWVGTAAGLARVEGNQVDLGAGIAAGLAGARIESLALDRAGDLWVGTTTGLVKLPVRSWVSAGDPVDGFVSAVGHASTGDGYAVGDGILYVADGDGWSAVAGLEDRRVITAAPDRSGGILVGTDLGWGTARDGTFTLDGRCCSRPVEAIFEDDVGRIWVGTGVGVSVVDADGEVASFGKSGTEAGLGQDPVVDIFAGASGTVWVATVNGGATPFTGLVEGVRVSQNSTGGGLSSDLVRVGLVTSTGDLWLGTQVGLSRRVGGTWTTGTGVLGGPIASLEDAADGRVWVGTESSGLVLVDCSILFDGGCAVSLFDEADGLGAPHVPSLARRATELWIGTSRGLTRHALDDEAPTLTLGSVDVVDSPGGDFQQLDPGLLVVDGKPCEAPCVGALPHGTRTVDVGLVAADLEDPQGIRFLVDSEVARSQLVDRAAFPRVVEPDTVYRTTVTAFDRHFNRSLPVTDTFAIEPTPFYLQLWFWLIAGILAALAVLGVWLFWQRLDRHAYRAALVAFRQIGDRVETGLEVDGRSPDWRPVGEGLTQLANLHDQLKAMAQPDRHALATLGDELYRTVLGGSERAQELAGGRPIRLGLDLAGVRALEPLPWEVMQGGAALGDLATEGRLALVRRVDVTDEGAPPRGSTLQGRRPTLIRGRLRVLVAWARPHDRTFVASGEYEAIEEVATKSGGRLEMVPMLVVQRDRLAAELDQDIDVFHFIGHGEMRKEGPVLLFEDEDGDAHATSLERLRAMLAGAEGRTRRPRLLVLSACQSAEDATDQPATGLAAGLVAAGVVPAAIGMGYVFHMQSASHFSREFYGSLIRHGQVEHAVAFARSAVRTAAVDQEDWLVPRLYARDLGAATFDYGGGRR